VQDRQVDRSFLGEGSEVEGEGVKAGGEGDKGH